MDSHEQPSRRSSVRAKPAQVDPKARAYAHRDAMSRRARRIRRSVASLAAVIFSTAFLVIYVQLASGHDPALVANAKRTATTSTDSGSAKASTTSASTGSSTTESTPTPSTTSSTGSNFGESSSGSSTSSSEESSSGASAVTTSQS